MYIKKAIYRLSVRLRHRCLPWFIGVLFGMHAALLVAAPEGGNVVSGRADIAADGKTTTIKQHSQELITHWERFNIAQDETVQFKQPSASARALNRIFDQDASQIFGRLQANGQVWLINPNGLFFGKTASINVGSLLASTLDISDDDFLDAGKDYFKAADAVGSIINQGTITAATGGSVNLLGNHIDNSGTIQAEFGQVNLVSGRAITVDFEGDGLLRFVVNEETLENSGQLDSTIENSGEIDAKGGQVLLSAQVARDIFDHAVNNSGTIRANRIEEQSGVIKLIATGPGGNIHNSGELDVSSTDGDGGTIHIEADQRAIIAGQSRLRANSSAGAGGMIKVIGDKVALLDRSILDVSGATAGGQILIGGGYQGKDPNIRNAYIVYVGEQVVINADATADGDGGQIIVWADHTTRFYGTATARGGTHSGDGGLIETSGKYGLDVHGSQIDASASNGVIGSWLLDPLDITIVGTASSGIDGDGSDSSPFTPASSPAEILNTDITDKLATTNVTIQTSDSGDEEGNITVTAAIETTGIGALTLIAHNDIIINAEIDIAGSIDFRADGDITVAAAISTDNNATLQVDADDNEVSTLDLSEATIKADTLTLAGSGDDILIGPNGETTWNVGDTSSTLTSSRFTITNNNNAASFSGFTSLLGGNQADTFNINTAFTGNLDGGGGSDTLTAANQENTWLFTSTTAGTLNNDIAFSNIENLVGGTGQDTFNINTAFTGNLDGGGGSDTLTAANQENTWLFTSTTAGTLNNDIAFSNIENLVGGTGQDTFNINTAFTGNLDGGGGSDTLTAANQENTWLFTSTTAGTLNNDIAFSNIENLVGGTGQDSLTGADVTNTWTLTAAGTGALNGINFSNIENLVGGTGQDTFNINTAFTGNLDGGGGSDTLTAANQENTWLFTSTTAGTLNNDIAFSNIENLVGGTGQDSLTGADVTNTWTLTAAGTGALNGINFSNIENLVGGTGQDTFNINTAFTGNLDGGGGSDTLTAANQENTWLFTSTTAGTLNNDIAFSNIENLVGGTGQDTFNINTAFTGNLDGGGGSDTLTAANQENTWLFTSTTAGTLNNDIAFSNIENLVGGTGQDSLTGADVTNTWTLTAAGTGALNGINFSNIENLVGGTGQDTFNINTAFTGNLDGGGGSDTLTAANQENTWLFTSTTAGTLNNDIAFSNIENLVGGTGQDTFNINTAFTGNLDGGGGSDTLTAANQENTWLFTSTTAGTLNNDIAFSNIENLVGGTGQDSLTGADVTNTWTLTAAGTGALNGINFSNIENLVGGTGQDTFNINTAFTGNLDGGGGSDTLTAANQENTWLFTSTTAGTLNNDIAFSNIENLVGGTGQDTFNINTAFTGNLDGGGGSDTLTAANQENTWLFTSTTAGTLNNDIAFSNIENLVGGTGQDTFNINTAFTGNLDGGGGSDTLTAANQENTWLFTSTTAGTLNNDIAFSNIENLVGGTGQDTFNINTAFTGNLDGGGGSDTLTAANQENTWLFTSTTAGTLNNDIAFSNIENLVGGTGQDSLTGADVTNTWTLTAAGTGALNGINFSNIENLVGGTGQDTFNINTAFTGNLDGGGGSDTLTAANQENTWLFTSTTAGTLNNDIAFSNIENLVGGTGQDTFNINTAFTGNLDGGGGSDTLTAANQENTWLFTSTTAGTLNNDIAFSNIENLVGGTGQDSLTGADVTNTWTLTAAGTGALNGINFSNIENLVGGTGQDTFNVGVAFTGNLDGGGGSDTLTAANQENTWLFTSTTAGTLNNDIAFSNIENLVGGTGQDTFNINTAFTGNLDGGGGSDTLTAANQENTWLFTSTTAGTLNNDIAFSNIENLVGGTGQDSLTGADVTNTWTLTAAGTGALNGINFSNIENLVGGTGQDTFNINTAFTGNLDGGGGSDTLTAANQENTWLFTSTTAGTLNNDIAFSNIENLVGGTGQDSLTGADVTNTWTLTAAGTGALNGINFSNIENLVGGTGQDTFNINTAFTGNLDGGGGSDTLTAANQENTWLFTSTTAGTLNNDIAFSNIENLVGGTGQDTFNINTAFTGNLDGGGGSDTLTAANQENTWLFTSTTAGTLNNDIAFSNIENLVGGTGQDTFNINTAFTGNLDGGGGSDTLTAANQENTWLFTSTTAGTLNNDIAFSNIENLVGGTGQDSLTGADVTNTWTLTAAGTGALNGINFSNIENLVGGTGQDTFNINTAFTGNLDGGGGSDTLTAANQENTWLFTSTTAGTLNNDIAFSNIENLVGGTGQDSLTGADVTNTWTLTAAGTGALNGINFSNIENLVGGTGQDTFNINTAFTGNLDGGGGSDTLTAANQENTWLFTSTTAGTLNNDIAFSNIENLVGGTGQDTFNINTAFTGNLDGGGGSDTLTAANQENTWLFTSTTAGTLNNDIAFSNIENLVGGTGQDTFNINTAFTGNLDGGGGSDTLTAANQENTWLFTSTTAGTLNNDIAFSNIENLVGGTGQDTFNINTAFTGNLDGGGGSDTLTAANQENTWLFTSTTAGTLNNDIAFSNIENLVGGTGQDTFNINTAFTGNLDGGGGSDTLTAANQENTWLFTSTTAGTLNNDIAFSNIENLVGGTGQDSLTGADVTNTWTLTAAGTGALNGINFSNIENLVGGTGQDTFNINTAFTGNLDGGGGSDTLTAANQENTWLFTSTTAGTLNNDIAFSNIENLVGGTGQDSLTGADVTNTWTLTAAGTGALNGINFSNIENLVGGTGQDTFNINTAFTGNLDGGGGSDTLTAANQENTWLFTSTTAGTLNNDIAFSNIENLVGGTGQDSLTGADVTNTWTLTAAGTGALNGINFSNIENLVGGTGQDTFNINTAFTGNLDGGGGSDTLTAANQENTWLFTSTTAGTLNNDIAFSNIENLVGGTGQDTFNINTAFTGNLSGGAGDDIFNLNAQVSGTVSGGTGINELYANQGIDGTYEVSGDDIWFYRTGIRLADTVTGDGSLTALPGAGVDADLTVGDGDLLLPTLTAFTGHLIIGGLLEQPTTPFYLTTEGIDVRVDTINVHDPIASGGSITLFSRGAISLGADITTTGGAVGMVSGASINAPQEVTISAPNNGGRPSAVFVASAGFVNSDNIELALAGGEVDVAVGGAAAGDAGNMEVEFNAASNSSDSTTDADFARFIESILPSLGFDDISVVDTFTTNPATVLSNLQQPTFFDESLFEQELTLYGQIGIGIAMALAQCEQQEGCAPNVSREELDDLITQLEERLDELEQRLAKTATAAVRAELEELVTDYHDELIAFRSYRDELDSFFAAEEAAAADESDELAEDDFSELERVMQAPAVVEGEIRRLTGILQVIKARLRWLVQLKTDTEMRAHLRQVTDFDLSEAAIEKLINAAQIELEHVERQIRLFIEGPQALLDGKFALAG